MIVRGVLMAFRKRWHRDISLGIGTVSPSFLLSKDGSLRAALDAMPHKVWIVEIDGPAIYYNPVMRSFADGALNLPDRTSRERALIHPDDFDRFARARSTAVAAQANWTEEVRLKGRDVGYRWHRLHFSILRSKDAPPAYLGTATDIDDLRRALTTAQESEEQLRLAAEAAQLGVYVLDFIKLEQSWSADLKKIFGFAPEEPSPQTIVELIHPDDWQKFEAARSASLDPSRSGTFEDEHRIIRRDGSVGWVLVKGRNTFGEIDNKRRPVRGIGLVLDVTKRKKAELALMQSEARYRLLFEQANDVVVTLQLDGRIETINPASREILGFAPEELIGKTIYEFVPRSLVPMQVDQLQRKLDGAPSTQYDLEVITKDKRRRTLGVNSRLVFDDAGKPAFIHSIARDITERKDAERRQELLVLELQHRTKNLLAVIQSIATRTLARGAERETFVGRLHALAHAQEFIAAGPQGGVPIHKLIGKGLSPFGARVKIEGPQLTLNGGFAQNLALLVHELATNALKYGALSTANGWAEINWGTTSGISERLSFHWRECEGPPVREPERKGFGTSLMSLFAGSKIAYEASGLSYGFDVPLNEALPLGPSGISDSESTSDGRETGVSR